MPRLGPENRPSLLGQRTSFTFYPGDTRYTGYAFPGVGPGWTISASIALQAASANGPVLLQGDHFGGQALLLEGGKPTFIYNPLGGTDHLLRLQAVEPLNAGQHTLAVAFSPSGAQGAIIGLMVDGHSVAQAAVERVLRARGDAYVGRAGIALFMPGFTMPPACSCVIDFVKIEQDTESR